MAVLTITKDKGGTSRPTAMTSVPQPQEVQIAALQGLAQRAGVNGAFLADTISAFATHERIAARFANAAARQTSAQELQALHENCARAHLAHLAIMEELMQAIALDPMYVSPAARMTTYVNERLGQAPLLSGSIDQVSLEITLVGLQLAMLEEDRLNVQLLAEVAARIQPSELKNVLQVAAERLGTAIAQPLEQVRTAYATLFLGCVMGQTKK